jgi:hypothetical protein
MPAAYPLQNLPTAGGSASLGCVHFAEFFELHAQPVTERAFGSQFVQQILGFIEILERKILRLEQIAKASLNLVFGKQGSVSRQ